MAIVVLLHIAPLLACFLLLYLSVGGTIANKLLLQAEISHNYNLVVESKWTGTGCVKMFCRSLTPCRAAVTAADWWLRKNGTDTGLSQPMGTLAILLRTNRTRIHNVNEQSLTFNMSSYFSLSNHLNACETSVNMWWNIRHTLFIENT